MNSVIEKIRAAAAEGVRELFGKETEAEKLTLNETSREFEGDFTLVLFPLAKLGLGKPEEFGQKLGEYLQQRLPLIRGFNVVKGFLNLSLADAWWKNFLLGMNEESFLHNSLGKGRRVVVEFSSPNTNKPLHLGHLRNNFLGFSIARILEACGYDVKRVCVVNDRGIAICKSMLMYIKNGQGQTPESTGKKPDYFVVQFYVSFGDELARQAEALVAGGMDKKEAEEKAPLMQEARELLRKWEAGDAETLAVWKKMNDWVYQGFDQTYARIGVKFDKIYYESQTYLLGNDLVDEGLNKEVFYQKEDGSVWLDLSQDGLDQKVFRRADGTSLYITQDLGTAVQRQVEYAFDKGIYVVADEQDYHFKVLFLALKKLGFSWAEGLYHLSYGMVELPEGRMKTRTGTTVDADDLIDEVVKTALEVTEESGKTEGMNAGEKEELAEKIGLAALRFFLLKVHPKKRMLFNPRESVDINGFTGPFVQYAYARTRALSRKAKEMVLSFTPELAGEYETLYPAERGLLRALFRYPEVLKEAHDQYDPSAIANFVYDLAKEYNRFYHELPVLKAQPAETAFRMRLSEFSGTVFREALNLLGIEVPERM